MNIMERQSARSRLQMTLSMLWIKNRRFKGRSEKKSASDNCRRMLEVTTVDIEEAIADWVVNKDGLFG